MKQIKSFSLEEDLIKHIEQGANENHISQSQYLSLLLRKIIKNNSNPVISVD